MGRWKGCYLRAIPSIFDHVVRNFSTIKLNYQEAQRMIYGCVREDDGLFFLFSSFLLALLAS